METGPILFLKSDNKGGMVTMSTVLNWDYLIMEQSECCTERQGMKFVEPVQYKGLDIEKIRDKLKSISSYGDVEWEGSSRTLEN